MRQQLSKALGGRRGMVEAAVPTILFTVTWLTVRDLDLALSVSVGAALVLLAYGWCSARRVQFVVNALFGIGIGWYFVHRSAAVGRLGAGPGAGLLPARDPLQRRLRRGAGASPASIGWPLVGFMVGSITGDPTAWHSDQQVVRLCSRLTWLLVAPVRAAGGHPGADLAGRALGVDGPRRRRGRARRPEDRPGLAAPARRARRDGVAALAQPHPGRAGRRRPPEGRASAGCWPGERSCSSSVSTSVGTTNSSSSPDSSGCSASGV